MVYENVPSEQIRDELDAHRVRLIGASVLRTNQLKQTRGEFGLVTIGVGGFQDNEPLVEIASFTDLRIGLIDTMLLDHITEHQQWETRDQLALDELTIEHIKRAGEDNAVYAKSILERNTPHIGLERVAHGITTMAEMYIMLLESIHISLPGLTPEAKAIVAENSFHILQKLMAFYLFDFENYTKTYTEKNKEGRYIFTQNAIHYDVESQSMQFSGGGLYAQLQKAPTFASRTKVSGGTKKCPGLRIDQQQLKELWMQCIYAAQKNNLL